MPHDPTTRTSGPVERFVADMVGRRWVWVVLVAISTGLPLAKAWQNARRDPPPPVPIIRSIPDFVLTSQAGRPFGAEQLRGKLWVANFIFTNCPSVCPQLTQAMAMVKKRSKNMKGAVQFVSISVDPTRDVPAVLDQYAERYHARGDWNFLTGTVADVRKLVIQGFKLGMATHDHSPGTLEEGKRDEAAELIEIAHGQQLVLVDSNMNVRGYYNPNPPGIDDLMYDMNLVATELKLSVRSLDPSIPITSPPVGSMPASVPVR